MKQGLLVFLRTTLVGGITFLLPIVLIAFIFGKAMELARKLAQPALKLLPDSLAGGVFIGALETALMVLIVAFAAGLMARTEIGQRFVAWVENSLIGTLPQFNFVRGLADSIDETHESHVEVVLVPADAGWALGFVFERNDGPIVPVFLPGAPQWTSGSVVFAERSAMRPAGIDFFEAMQVLKKLGVNSAKVCEAIARDQAPVM